MDDEAVSPVIGVILMVAIAVVLAGVVFVLVTDLTDDRAPPPIAFAGEADDTQDRWTVTIGPDEPKGEFAVRGAAGVKWVEGVAATDANSAAMDGSAQQLSGTAPWASGGFISLCGDGAPVSNYELHIVHVSSNSLVASHTYQSIAQCA